MYLAASGQPLARESRGWSGQVFPSMSGYPWLRSHVAKKQIVRGVRASKCQLGLVMEL